MRKTEQLSCACGKFHIELEGAPFITTECHCNSCREAANRLADLPIAGTNGGTPFVLYRKDRVRFPDGSPASRSPPLRQGTHPSRRHHLLP